MCNLVKGNLGLAISVHSARVTLNTSMSWSMGLHVWDGMPDFSREPHVMCDAVRLRIRICTCALRAHLLSVWERIRMRLCFTGHLEKHWTHCPLAHRLALPLQWLETFPGPQRIHLHMWSRMRCKEGKNTEAKSKSLQNQSSQSWGAFPHPARRQKLVPKEEMWKKIKIQFY